MKYKREILDLCIEYLCDLFPKKLQNELQNRLSELLSTLEHLGISQPNGTTYNMEYPFMKKFPIRVFSSYSFLLF